MGRGRSITRLSDKLQLYKKGRNMDYVTTVEQIGMEKARNQIALNLLKQDVSIEVIAQATGLTIAQLKKLQAKNPA
jgi:predicted transposase YdaD